MEATILKLYPLGENGLIIVWCTREGLLRTAAKGARKPTSAFAGRLDLFHLCDIEYTRAKSGTLHTLTSVELINPRLGLRSEYVRLALAGYFAKLLLLVIEQDTPIPDFYDLLTRALAYAETTHPTKKALLHFENELARLHGIDHPGATSAEALSRHFGRLPAQRIPLLDSLSSS